MYHSEKTFFNITWWHSNFRAQVNGTATLWESTNRYWKFYSDCGEERTVSSEPHPDRAVEKSGSKQQLIITLLQFPSFSPLVTHFPPVWAKQPTRMLPLIVYVKLPFSQTTGKICSQLLLVSSSFHILTRRGFEKTLNVCLVVNSVWLQRDGSQPF